MQCIISVNNRLIVNTIIFVSQQTLSGCRHEKGNDEQWGYVDEGHDTLCECGEHEQRVLQCRLLEDAVTQKDLVLYNKKAQQCVERCMHSI